MIPAAALLSRDFMTRASVLADAAENHEDAFINHGMQANFVEQLRAALEQIRAASDARNRHKVQQVLATVGLDAAEKSARKLMRVMDAVLTPILRKNPALLADWVASKRIARAGETLGSAWAAAALGRTCNHRSGQWARSPLSHLSTR